MISNKDPWELNVLKVEFSVSLSFEELYRFEKLEKEFVRELVLRLDKDFILLLLLQRELKDLENLPLITLVLEGQYSVKNIFLYDASLNILLYN